MSDSYISIHIEVFGGGKLHEGRLSLTFKSGYNNGNPSVTDEADMISSLMCLATAAKQFGEIKINSNANWIRTSHGMIAEGHLRLNRTATSASCGEIIENLWDEAALWAMSNKREPFIQKVSTLENSEDIAIECARLIFDRSKEFRKVKASEAFSKGRNYSL